jgi:hypothetical protein
MSNDETNLYDEDGASQTASTRCSSPTNERGSRCWIAHPLRSGAQRLTLGLAQGQKQCARGPPLHRRPAVARFSLFARRALEAPELLNSPVCFSHGERGCPERAHGESSRKPAFERIVTADLHLVGSRAEHPSNLLSSSAPPTLPV